VQGRFEMIVLHMFLVLGRLKGEGQELAQRLVDEFFRDMDRSLRELGVADVGVGKKVRRMAEAFYGRLAAYDKGLAGDPHDLAAALDRNVFPDGGNAAAARKLAAYAASQRQHLAGQPLAALVAGAAQFLEPSP
jgi:cytochrome b pre-mRNA-processing protein 3